MTKREFLIELNRELACISPEDRKEPLEYYSEIIDERAESGMSESEAVAMLGDVRTVADEILSEMPISKLIKNRVTLKSRPSASKTVLMIFGGLIVVPIIIAVIASVFATYASLWAVVISLFASALACAVAGVLGIFLGALYVFLVGFLEGMWIIGASLIALGLVYPLYLLGKWLSITFVWLTRKTAILIKRCVLGRGI